MAVSAKDVASPSTRIPKLTYRNPLPDQDLNRSSSGSESSLSIQVTAQSVKTDTIARNPSVASTAQSSHRSSDSRSTTSSTESSLAPSHVSTSKSSKTSSRKKKNAVFGFLSVKEPSQVALEQFAKSQHQSNATKSTSSMPVGMQNHASPKKLPSTVPKVNSKWDGLPESSRSSQMSTRSTRSSKSSIAPSDRNDSLHGYNTDSNTSALSVASVVGRRPTPSLASPMASTTDVSQTAGTASSATAALTSPSQTSLPEMSRYLSNDPNLMSGALSTSSLKAEDSTENMVEQLYINTEADTVFRKLQGDRIYRNDEATTATSDSDSDATESVPETHGFLFESATPTNASRFSNVSPPPSPAPSSSRTPSFLATPLPLNQSLQSVESPARLSPSTLSRPPRTGFLRSRTSSKPVPVALPTVYEASVASTDNIADTPDGTETNKRRSFDSVSIAESTADSFTPSVMSASWNRTPKDRLGLGGRIRKNDILPWEKEDQAVSGKPKKGRLSVFSKFSV